MNKLFHSHSLKSKLKTRGPCIKKFWKNDLHLPHLWNPDLCFIQKNSPMLILLSIPTPLFLCPLISALGPSMVLSFDSVNNRQLFCVHWPCSCSCTTAHDPCHEPFPLLRAQCQQQGMLKHGEWKPSWNPHCRNKDTQMYRKHPHCNVISLQNTTGLNQQSHHAVTHGELTSCSSGKHRAQAEKSCSVLQLFSFQHLYFSLRHNY